MNAAVLSFEHNSETAALPASPPILQLYTIHGINGINTKQSIYLLSLMLSMVSMVLVGKSKYDNNGRITLMKEVAELMNLVKGEDYVELHVQDGQLIIKKETKKYVGGFDFEEEEIRDNLQNYEKERLDDLPDITDPEQLEKLAREQYEKDRAAREAKKNNKP